MSPRQLEFYMRDKKIYFKVSFDGEESLVTFVSVSFFVLKRICHSNK